MPIMAEPEFEIFELQTGLAEHQIVLSGFVYTDPASSYANLIVINVDDQDNRDLVIYTLIEKNWVSVSTLPIGKQVIFVDLVKVGGVDRLLLFERNRVSWLQPETGEIHFMKAIATIYNVPLKHEILSLDVSRDVNDDGLEDLLLPGFDGYQLFMQHKSGQGENEGFSDPVVIGPPSEMNISIESNPWYQPRAMHKLDYDHDGRSDLVFWNTDHFDVYLQDQKGMFTAKPERFNSNVAFDADGFYSLEFGDDLDDEDEEQKVLFSLSDLSGDGTADLMTYKLEGRSVFGKKSTYEIYLGKKTPAGKTIFQERANTTIRSKGVQFDIQDHDFDLDGQTDMLVMSVELGIGKIVGALLTGSTSFDLGLYRMEGGRYPEKPNVTRKVKVEFDLSTGTTFVPSVLVADITGDGRSDLIVQEGRDALKIFVGVAGTSLFAKKAILVALTLPDKEDSVRLADLNRDHKMDILMHFQSSSRANHITLLIAK